MPLYDAAVPQTRKMLVNLSSWLAEAEKYAESRSFDPETLLGLRLYPDMLPLTRQIQGSCDAAKFAAARLAGKAPPKHPDEETTLAELKVRIQSVIDYLDSFTPADFEGAEERVVALPFIEGKGALAGDYLNEMALPNFYFHLTTAYNILRTNGVLLGKRTFIGGMKLVDL